MEATKFSSHALPRLSCSPPLSLKKRNKIVLSCGGRSSGGEYEGNLVDENMISLRIRLRELEMSENGNNPPQHWMEWEKKYFPDYYSDVCEEVGLLQNFLMNVRPSLGIGMMALVALSVPTSTWVVLFHVFEMAKRILSGFHLLYGTT